MSLLVDAVLSGLASRADPERARWQQDYMKSELPFHGVSLPETRALVRAALKVHPQRDRATWEATVRELYDEAAFREERYAALVVARSGRQWLDAASLPLSRHLVVTGAWWDLVDETATHLVGHALMEEPAAVTPAVRDWATDADVWLRRTAVICQLRHGPDTDLDLLSYAIEANVDEAAFSVVEDQIYSQAIANARNPASVPEHTLRPVSSVRETGHRQTDFIGQPKAWMSQFSSAATRYVTAINQPK